MSDILVVLLIAVAVRDGITGPYQTVGDALISGPVLLAWNRVIDRLAYHSTGLRRILRHAPRRLIDDGRLVDRAARDHLLTEPEIMQKLRQSGVSSYEQVRRRASMEQDGSVTVVKQG